MGIFSRKEDSEASRKIGYAVVGLGHIAQAAVLPAFRHAENSRLCALVSNDQDKRRELGERYGVRTYSYEEYEQCLEQPDVDAVYIALPNSLHREYAERAANKGVHVLCEKPMAVTEQDCEAMVQAAASANVKLMIAYRLHFEEANLKAIEVVQSGEIGEPRLFNSTFCLNVKEGNIRLKKDLGGGVLYDIGIYCINAARYLFRDEPVEVLCASANNGEPRFSEVDEMHSAILRFPGERLASFSASFGAADVSSYRIVGTRGDLRVDPAYEYDGDIVHYLTVEGKTREHTFKKRDQFAPELVAFSQAVLEDKDLEPSGREGQADVRIIQALLRSAETGLPVRLLPFAKGQRPDPDQEMKRPPVKKPDLLKVESATG